MRIEALPCLHPSLAEVQQEDMGVTDLSGRAWAGLLSLCYSIFNDLEA